MPFSKATNEPDIRIEVKHSWHPGVVFAFTFPKRLTQLAADAEARFLGLKEDAREDEHRLALIQTVAEMVTKEPEGFDDFPIDEKLPPGGAPRSLSVRFRDYFDEPSQVELEQILIGAWRAYRASSVPSAYMKSDKDTRARDGQSSGATAQAESKV